jgi:hypothetical protein
LKILSLTLLLVTTIFFSACASKEVFEPEPDSLSDDWEYYGSTDFTIKSRTPKAALVEDNMVMVDGEVTDISIAEDYNLIGYSDGWIISASIDGKLVIANLHDRMLLKKFDLKKTISTASVKGDMLSVLFANNTMAVYSISSKELLVKEQGDPPVVVNSKVTAPFYKDNLVIFPTLDGKIVIVDVESKKKLRTAIISSEDNFNNAIYFNFIGNRIVTATGHKILSLAEKELRVKYDIRVATDDGKNIFLATKQGEIVSLTPDLQLNKKVKFPFAHFLGLVVSDNKVYALEKQGYMIVLSKDLLEYSIHEVDIEEDAYIFLEDKVFYIGDEYILAE